FAIVYADSLPPALLRQVGALGGQQAMLLAALLLLIAPGLLLAFAFVDRGSPGLATQLALAPAFGAALLPLFVLYASEIGVPVNGTFTWILVVGSVFAAILIEVGPFVARGLVPRSCPGRRGTS